MAKDKNVTGEEILDVCSSYMSADDLKLVEKAWHYATDAHSEQFRSEERRVGKECRIGCRSRWSPYH